jgi:hypothetical protein
VADCPCGGSRRRGRGVRLAGGTEPCGGALQAAVALMDAFLAAFPGVGRLWEEVWSGFEREGCARTLAGRTKHFPGVKANDAKVSARVPWTCAALARLQPGALPVRDVLLQTGPIAPHCYMYICNVR